MYCVQSEERIFWSVSEWNGCPKTRLGWKPVSILTTVEPNTISNVNNLTRTKIQNDMLENPRIRASFVNPTK